MSSNPTHLPGPAWIDLDGAVNARDLGGLPADGGGVTRSGVLFRSDALDALSDGDVRKLTDDLGLVHVVDLRAVEEREERGRGRLGRSSVRYSELQVFDREAMERRRADRLAAVMSGTDPAEIMAQGYRFLLDIGTATFVEAVTLIAGSGGTPALIHCAAGKDRTGILVALLLELAGVERSAVIRDYAATADRMPYLIDRLRSADVFHQSATELPAFVYDAQAATMATFLGALDRAWGSPAGFLTAHGVPETVRQTWRDLFVDPV